MTTINIHKDKLLPAAFAYQQRKLKESNPYPEYSIDWYKFRYEVALKLVGEALV